MREARCRLVSVDPLPCCSTESDQAGHFLPLPASETATHPPSKKMVGCPQYQFQPKQSSALGMDGSWTSDAFGALCQSILCCSAKSLLCLTAPRRRWIRHKGSWIKDRCSSKSLYVHGFAPLPTRDRDTIILTTFSFEMQISLQRIKHDNWRFHTSHYDHIVSAVLRWSAQVTENHNKMAQAGVA